MTNHNIGVMIKILPHNNTKHDTSSWNVPSAVDANVTAALPF